jgi:enoyl-CoA hydratase
MLVLPEAQSGVLKLKLDRRDHSVGEGLEYVATWNSAQMPSKDLEAVTKNLLSKSKQQLLFSRL